MAVFKDDGESSYTFDRPDYIALENFIKRHKGKVKYLIVMDHDRFSRNLPEALTKIALLEKKYGLKVLATSEALDIDTSDPTVFIERSFKYLLANAELFRIRKRVKNGIRSAQEAGRFVHVAPFGYINRRDVSGKSNLMIDEDKAVIIRKIFHDYLRGVPKYLIHLEVRKLGYTVNGNSAVARTLNNGTYAGLVKVGADGKEPERYVQGVHQPIISEELFWLAQEKLGNKRVMKSQPKSEFFLRGIIASPCCWLPMTAGWSKGKQKYYIYYRCVKHSNVNIPGAKMHATFEKLLEAMNFTKDQVGFIKQRAQSTLGEQATEREKQNEARKKALNLVESKIDKLEQRYMDDEIEPETYKKYFKKYKSEQAQLQSQIRDVFSTNTDLLRVQLNRINQLTRISVIFKRAELSQQHAFLKEVFKQGLTFIEGVFRTPWLHPAFEHNLLTLKAKRLLFLEQPSDNFGGIPRGGAGGIRTLVQTWYKVSFLHA